MVTRRDFFKKAGMDAAATAILFSMEFKPAQKHLIDNLL